MAHHLHLRNSSHVASFDTKHPRALHNFPDTIFSPMWNRYLTDMPYEPPNLSSKTLYSRLSLAWKRWAYSLFSETQSAELEYERVAKHGKEGSGVIWGPWPAKLGDDVVGRSSRKE